jgi:formylglycine-generating enzyme required for sulfatase activity
MEDFQALRLAVEAGFGWTSRQALCDLCCALWAKSRRDRDLVATLFTQLDLDDWILSESDAPLDHQPPPEPPGNEPTGFSVRLIPSLNDVLGIPTEGRKLIIVAAVNNVLHFRIFDGDGKVVVDADEKRLTEQARRIEDLRKQLESLWPPHELTRSDKSRIITAVTSIVLDPYQLLQMVRIRRTPEPVTYRDDPNEQHGPIVGTRGAHSLHLPEEFAVGRYLVTNATFLEFVREGGYHRDDFWKGVNYAGFLCGDGLTRGPASWPSNRGPRPEQRHHPVTGISFVEALAFCRWLQRTKPDLLESGWRWGLPQEDMWEYVARTESGLRYPWGNEFEPDRCNSAEQKLGTTSEVTRFPRGRSSVPGAPDVEGCYDMAGNVWELVVAEDTRFESCVLRGGSYRNTQAVVQSYLRLHRVSIYHRPPDFGFRCAQYPEQGHDLRLMSSVNDVSGIPTEGKRLIIVAAVHDVLHFRIFDSDGEMVVNTDEKRLTDQAQQIESLRKQLESLWPPHGLTSSEKDGGIVAVTSIVGYHLSTKSALQEESPVVEPLPRLRPRPIHERRLRLTARPFVFVPQFPLNYREVAQAWRRLRRPLRAGPSVELDVDASVVRWCRQGVISQAVLVPRRRNTANLLLLVDRQGSMAPFHAFLEEVCHAIEEAGRLERAAVYYFHDVPAEGSDPEVLRGVAEGLFRPLDPIIPEIPPLTTGDLYRDRELLDPVPIEEVLSRDASGAAVVLFSDGGAARRRRDTLRLLDTLAFFKALRNHTDRYVWLNPLPQRNWLHTTCAEIARHVPMFPLDRRGIYLAVNVLRGHVYPLERPL